MSIFMVNLIVITITATLVSSAVSAQTNTSVDICGLDPILIGKVNSCKALYKKFTYNSAVGKCENFIYGGCYGSANLFDSKQECEQTCESPRVRRAENPRKFGKKSAICSQRVNFGHCRAAIPSFYYNQESRRCIQFNYGGCGGNENNFPTIQACRAACE